MKLALKTTIASLALAAVVAVPTASGVGTVYYGYGTGWDNGEKAIASGIAGALGTDAKYAQSMSFVPWEFELAVCVPATSARQAELNKRYFGDKWVNADAYSACSSVYYWGAEREIWGDECIIISDRGSKAQAGLNEAAAKAAEIGAPVFKSVGTDGFFDSTKAAILDMQPTQIHLFGYTAKQAKAMSKTLKQMLPDLESITTWDGTNESTEWIVTPEPVMLEEDPDPDGNWNLSEWSLPPVQPEQNNTEAPVPVEQNVTIEQNVTEQ